MGLKYVLNSMKRRKLRTFVVALALIVGVALVGALLNLVDTQRQFSLQIIGATTGGYDLAITRSDLAQTPFFDAQPADRLAREAYSGIAASHPRIQGDAEASTEAGARTGLSMVALNVDSDDLSQITPNSGVYPPQPGQVFLSPPAADALGVKVGDEITLSYVLPTPREEGKAEATNGSTARAEASFVVAGIGLASGLSGGIGGFGQELNPLAMIRLEDAQAWLGVPGQADRLLLVWQSDTSLGSDVQAIVSRARDAGARVRDLVQAQLGPDYTVELNKYRFLDGFAAGFIITQVFITLYGILSMGIVGLMVNALMTTAVNEQKYDLAILRVLGAPRWRLFEPVVIEVLVLGVIGVVFGLLLGRAINDFIITPLLLSTLQLPVSVRPEWTLQAVITPTLITAAILALATISPARKAAGTKVMVVLNPAAADQPTLEDLARLRERRANYGLLGAGLILLIFCAIILIWFPLIEDYGDFTAQAATYIATYLLMVVGMSLVFFFLATPLERILVALYNVIAPRAGFFAGRYALRGKSRNSLISLMVVASAVFPTLLATQTALDDANIETDTRFGNGTSMIVRPPGGRFFFFSDVGSNPYISADAVENVQTQPGVMSAVALAEGFSDEVSDRVQVRSARANFIGVRGDLADVVYPEFMQWAQGEASALARINTDPNAVVIAQGMSELLDLHLGDTIRVKGAGFDHERLMTIVGVASRLPGFSNEITRNRNSAEFGQTAVLMNLDTYRDLRHDPDKGAFNEREAIFTRVLAKIDPAVNETEVANAVREGVGAADGLDVSLTTEEVATSRQFNGQSRIFNVLLAGLSMVTAVFGVLAVMYTAVMSRRVEIGMLKAIGSPARTLRGAFIGEAIITTLAAAVAGIIAGTVLGYAFGFSQRFSQESPMLPAFDFTTAAIILFMVCLAAVFSAALATQPVIRQKAIRILREK
jgi:ABC-type antimicrobial peptide transport system permease subunit